MTEGQEHADDYDGSTPLPESGGRYEWIANDQARHPEKYMCQSVIDAGYSASGAYRRGWYIRRHPHYKKRLQWLLEIRAEDTVSTVQERRERLTEIHRARLCDFLITLPDGTTVIDYSSESKFPGAVQEITQQVRASAEGDGKGDVVIRKIKLHSPEKSIDLLNKMDNLYIEKHEVVQRDRWDEEIEEIEREEAAAEAEQREKASASEPDAAETEEPEPQIQE